jgi:hypothetical protein
MQPTSQSGRPEIVKSLHFVRFVVIFTIFVCSNLSPTAKKTDLKKLLILLIILSSCLTHSTRLFASHGMGGEITWTCLPGGQFKFQVKFYRDCNGIPGPPSVTMNTTVPGVPSIPCALFDQNDISPDGFTSNGATICPSCGSGNASNRFRDLLKNSFISQHQSICQVYSGCGMGFFSERLLPQ